MEISSSRFSDLIILLSPDIQITSSYSELIVPWMDIIEISRSRFSDLIILLSPDIQITSSYSEIIVSLMI